MYIDDATKPRHSGKSETSFKTMMDNGKVEVREITEMVNISTGNA